MINRLPRPAQPPVPIRATVGEAWRLLREHPAQILLPALVVTAPVSALVAITLTILRLTAFENEPLVLLSEITSDTNRALAFALVAAAGVEVLFGQVARGATVVAVASVATGRVKSLVEALDPAFTRMGAIISLAIVLAALGVGTAVLDTAGLSFLGLGAKAPFPEWGTILADTYQFYKRAPWMVAFPGLSIMAMVLGCNLLGDGLRDVLDPRMAEKG